jgi:hypothetical protein
MLSRKFKAPPRDDVKQWEKVERLVAAGFRFDTAWRWAGVGGMYYPQRYPEKLKEVEQFIRDFAPWLAAPSTKKRPRAKGRVRRKPRIPQRNGAKASRGEC